MMTRNKRDAVIETIKQWFRDNIDEETVFDAEMMLADDGTTGTVGYELLACHLESDLIVALNCEGKDKIIAIAKTWLLENVFQSNTVKYDFKRTSIGFAIMMGDLERHLEEHIEVED